MGDISRHKAYIMYALKKLGALTPAQVGRYLFENEICEQFDLRQVLTCLKEENIVKQAVSINGITYELTEDGTAQVDEHTKLFTLKEKEKLDAVGEDLQKKFRIETDYLARYSEQATGIVPLFLSLREGEKILFKVNIIVPDAATAEAIAGKWPENAQKAYHALWDCIGEGLPFPNFDGIMGEDKNAKT